MEINVKDIAEGHLNELLGKNKDVASERMEICKKCPLFLNELGGRCNPRLYLDPTTEQISVSKKPGYFKGCGCRLKAKTTVLSNHCPAKKW